MGWKEKLANGNWCVFKYVCVDHLKHGSCFAGPSHANEALGFSWTGAWAHTSVPVCTVYIHIVPPLGAFKPQLGGHIVYRC